MEVTPVLSYLSPVLSTAAPGHFNQAPILPSDTNSNTSRTSLRRLWAWQSEHQTHKGNLASPPLSCGFSTQFLFYFFTFSPKRERKSLFHTRKRFPNALFFTDHTVVAEEKFPAFQSRCSSSLSAEAVSESCCHVLLDTSALVVKRCLSECLKPEATREYLPLPTSPSLSLCVSRFIEGIKTEKLSASSFSRIVDARALRGNPRVNAQKCACWNLIKSSSGGLELNVTCCWHCSRRPYRV